MAVTTSVSTDPTFHVPCLETRVAESWQLGKGTVGYHIVREDAVADETSIEVHTFLL
jgi:hypothetical protein